MRVISAARARGLEDHFASISQPLYVVFNVDGARRCFGGTA